MLRSLFTGAIGGLTAAATSPDLQTATSSIIAAILGGGLLIALVAVYKARSEKNMNSTQAIAVLFEKQREFNIDMLKQRDHEIELLREQLEQANGDRDRLTKRLAECQRDRTVLRNQIKGLEATLTELGVKAPHPPRRGHEPDR